MSEKTLTSSTRGLYYSVEIHDKGKHTQHWPEFTKQRTEVHEQTHHNTTLRYEIKQLEAARTHAFQAAGGDGLCVE